MQRYRWPGYDLQLLGELQRQQNNAQFCDTLLQTEALSPYLSQKLTASPSPPSGQRRQLQLQAVKAQTLLKLVGLLYTGEVEVKGRIEQNDLLSAALQFGITDLIEGHEGVGMKEGEPQKEHFGSCRESYESRKMQDAQVQAEISERRAPDSPAEKTSCVSTGTQTVKADEKTADTSCTHSSQSKPPTPEPASSVAQSFDFSFMLQPQNVTLDRHFYSACFPTSIIPSRTPSDGLSTLDQSSDSVTNPTSAWLSDVMSFHSSYQQSSEFGDRIGTEKTNDKTTDRREKTEWTSHASEDERQGESKGNSIEKKHTPATVGMKSLSKMKMMETMQNSVRVKLRRKTIADWEVVSIQDADTTQLSHRDTHTPPQDNKKQLDHNLSPQTPERSAPLLSNTGGFIKSSGCDQEEEEEEEVDILFCSPDRVPQFTECEKDLNNMDMTSEEEEEEDMNEIDVTGDETE